MNCPVLFGRGILLYRNFKVFLFTTEKHRKFFLGVFRCFIYLRSYVLYPDVMLFSFRTFDIIKRIKKRDCRRIGEK